VDLGSRRPVPLSARPTRLDTLLDTVARTAEQTRYEDLAKSNVELTAQVQTLATTMSAFMLDKSTLLPVPAAMGWGSSVRWEDAPISPSAGTHRGLARLPRPGTPGSRLILHAFPALCPTPDTRARR
jgi:hypothetical protein